MFKILQIKIMDRCTWRQESWSHMPDISLFRNKSYIYLKEPYQACIGLHASEQLPIHTAVFLHEMEHLFWSQGPMG